MIIHKITYGYVRQIIDTDRNELLRQEFIADNNCEYDNEDGHPIDIDDVYPIGGDKKEPYFIYDMVQPKSNIK